MRRVLSLFLSLILLVGCFSVTASALKPAKIVKGPTRTVRLYGAGRTNHNKEAYDVLAPYVSVTQFFDYLKEEIANCREEVDVLEFGIPCTAEIFDVICDSLFYGMPECFNVDEIGISYFESGPDAGKIASLFFLYREFADTAAEYEECMAGIVSAADKLLKNIEKNKNLNDEQKLLLLHDRLAIWTQYGYSNYASPLESHTAHGALVNRTAVCQGYSMAYMYLLNRIGIDSYYCSSDEMSHGWNIVYLNGKAYHVDVTWDDIGWTNQSNGSVGNVIHDNFLRSSEGIRSTGHDGWDYDITPKDKKYDNYFWQNSKTEFQLVKNMIYYIDNKDQSIKRYGEQERLCDLTATWEADEKNNWVGNFSCLSNDGRHLLYSLPKAVYKFDLKTNKSESIYTPLIDKYESIFGFTYQDGQLVCDINNQPPGGEYNKKYQLTETYDGYFECRHENTNKPLKENEIFATCTQSGSYERVISCEDCGEEILRETITVDALGHTEKVKNENIVKATCTTTGSYDEITYCLVCEEELGKEKVILEIDPKNHTFNGDDECDNCGFEREPIESGDANEDGTVNNRDLAILMQFLNGWEVEVNEQAGDVNADGEVNNRDYALLMQRVNGWNV